MHGLGSSIVLFQFGHDLRMAEVRGIVFGLANQYQ